MANPAGARFHVGLLATHPIQYYAPWYRALAREVDLEVFFSHRQTAEGQAAAGFGVAFDWDVPLLEGYSSTFLTNVAKQPGVGRFWGCNTPSLAGIIHESRFDAFIVHGWSTWSYWQAIRACWRARTPILVRGDSILSTPRSAARRLAKWAIYRWFIPKFDGFLVVGARTKRYLEHYGAKANRCFPAPHAVDNDFFTSRAAELRPSRADLRREFRLPESAVTFLFAGRFIARKEPSLFVTALARAAEQSPNVAGLMVGDGPLRPEVEGLAARLRAPICFSGFLNQTAMVRAYAASDVLVVPSEWETWGLVVNEGMACGVPAIVSDGVGCVDDLVTPGETGEVFSVGDTQALAGHIARLAADEPYRMRLSGGAASRVTKFDIAAAVAGTIESINAVTTRRGIVSGTRRAGISVNPVSEVKR